MHVGAAARARGGESKGVSYEHTQGVQIRVRQNTRVRFSFISLHISIYLYTDI